MSQNLLVHMFFTKFPHPANFSFAADFNPDTGRFSAGARQFDSVVETFEDGIFNVRVLHDVWGENRCIQKLDIPKKCRCAGLRPGKHFELTFRNLNDKEFLKTHGVASFGVSGESWLFQFEVPEGTRFYGLGEKNFGRLELSGVRTKFWNTDVWGDFHSAQFTDQVVDPPYLSIPYVICKRDGEYFGILVDSPATAFIETPGRDAFRVFEAWENKSPLMVVGAECGQPSIWVIYGPTLRALTRKLQRLVGVASVPPIWSLGYHQSRWGYAGLKDLLSLDEKFAEHEIPCDALWLDIDYMNGFRVFTFDEEHFPGGFEKTAKRIGKSGRKVVAILDPGVKKEKGYPVYDDLKKKGLACKNPEGGEFVGIVWPGETIFPDLILPEGRDWWAGYAKRLFETGMGGVWLDMNDPSTGPVDPTAMLFKRGTERHGLHRNQYALGMQMATHKGFSMAYPNKRPFLLSRSGSTGTSRYSAIWTGDNYSNYFHLQMAVPATLNLSLSGIAFNGPDLGGFGGTTTEQLMTDWVKACCLFPFFRNHNSKGEGDQEPWEFSDEVLSVLRKYIRLRYRLLPYLYNIYCDHETDGDPILRPLLYEFESSEYGPLEEVSDQFMVGPFIMQAPVMHETKRSRSLILPGTEPWFDAQSGKWLKPGVAKVRPVMDETPMFFRQGAVIPFRPGVPKDNKLNLAAVDVLVVAKPGTSGNSTFRYRADDGETLDYRIGKRSETVLTISWSGKSLTIDEEKAASGFGQIKLSFLVPEGFETIRLNGKTSKQAHELLEIAGRPFGCCRLS